MHTKSAPQAEEKMMQFHAQTIVELEKGIKENEVVVVGMFLNPHVGKVKYLLNSHNIHYKYMEFGGYFSQWKKRLAIKIWSGWPTFPQVFIQGTLVGGASDTALLLKQGKIQKWLKHE